MNTNHRILILVLFLVGTTAFYGQGRPIRDKIKTLKVAFITERLSLTSEEAQVFWPIYNAHEDKIEAIKRKERTQIRSKLLDFDSLSEKEADAILSELITLEGEKAKLTLDYFEELRSVMPSKKIILLTKAEEDFKKRLLQEMRDRRRGGG